MAFDHLGALTTLLKDGVCKRYRGPLGESLWLGLLCFHIDAGHSDFVNHHFSAGTAVVAQKDSSRLHAKFKTR